MPQASAPADDRTPPPQSTVGWGLFVTLGIVSLLLFIGDIPDKIARWHWAAAYNHYLDGKLDAAIAALDPALAWDPSMQELYEQRGQWRMEQGKFEEALEDFDRALELVPKGRETIGFRIRVNDAASQALRKLGRCDEMSKRQDEIVGQVAKAFRDAAGGDDELELRAHVLNGRAYVNALCGLKLDGALEDMKKAIDLQKSISAERVSLHQQQHEYWQPSFSDTRAYILFRQGKLQAAQEEQDRAVAMEEEALNAIVRASASEQRFVDRRSIELRDRIERQRMGVLYHHRGEIYDELGRHFDAQEDFARAKRLGFDPEHGVE